MISRPKGTNDLLPEEIWRWQKLEQLICRECEKYNFHEVRTPIFEETRLFQRGLGETTDIVEKEMYVFDDKGGRSLTLRPEGTASIVRAYIENNLKSTGLPVKLFYLGPMFRYERPQAGRYRQFHQFGIECFGSQEPALDAEVIMLAYNIYAKLGAKNIELKINSIGCPGCRPKYLDRLEDVLAKGGQEGLCQNCLRRSKTNPLRVLDCKEEGCQEKISKLPMMKEYLCTECQDHYLSVKEILDIWKIEYVEDPRLVRGLDYYTKTVFEFASESLGAQNAVGGGGRYDSHVEEVGGPKTPAVGFAMGIERTILAFSEAWEKEPDVDLYIITIGDTKKEALMQLKKGRDAGLKTEMDQLNRSIKAQFKQANRLNARYCLILGPDELREDKVTIRNMEDGAEFQLALNDWLGGIK